MNAPAPSERRLRGPLETERFPERLSARVVEPGPSPRVHGYDVEGDLALHYQAGDLVLLSLTGELPAPGARAAFEVACMFLGPISVAEAPVHAAVLARLCAAPTSSIAAVAAIALAEQSRALVAEHATLFEWRAGGAGDLPSQFQSDDAAETQSVARLERALRAVGFELEVLAERPTRDAALLLTLCACGLERPEQIEAALVLARLPSTLAEALAEGPTNLSHYPINLPEFAYEEGP